MNSYFVQEELDSLTPLTNKIQKDLTMEAFKVLFRVQRVEVTVPDEDYPGPTRFKAICSRCGQVVRDRREVSEDGRLLCKPCTDEVYFRDAREITWPDMNWVPGKHLSQSRGES